jgi:hypothetical protein
MPVAFRVCSHVSVGDGSNTAIVFLSDGVLQLAVSEEGIHGSHERFSAHLSQGVITFELEAPRIYRERLRWNLTMTPDMMAHARRTTPEQLWQLTVYDGWEETRALLLIVENAHAAGQLTYPLLPFEQPEQSQAQTLRARRLRRALFSIPRTLTYSSDDTQSRRECLTSRLEFRDALTYVKVKRRRLDMYCS